MFENHVISRCQGLFPSTSFSVEKSSGNEVAVLRISRMRVSVYFCPPYLSRRRLKLSLTSHNNMISGKENSRLKVINSHLKQKYMFPESCSSEKATNQRKSERCVGFLLRKQRYVQDCNESDACRFQQASQWFPPHWPNLNITRGE